MKFKYRQHRSTLSESLKTTIELDSFESLEKYIYDMFGEGELTVKYYGMDDRCGWDTYLISHRGYAVGMTDGKVKNDPAKSNQFKYE